MHRYNPHLPEVTGKPLRHNALSSRRNNKPTPGRRGAVDLRAWAQRLVLALAVLAMGPVAAQSPKEAERKLQKLRSELKGVAQERRTLEGQRGQASRQLRDADEKVARTGRVLAQTETALQRETRAMEELQRKRSDLQAGMTKQREELASLLRSAYRIGNNAPLKLLLSQDRVADANRSLAYHRYLQRERARRIQLLTHDLAELQAVEAQIVERRQALEGTRQQQKQQVATLADDRRTRAATVASLDERYKDRSEREKALGQDAKALETLLANLRAAAARAEAERRAAARRAAAEKAAAEKAEKAAAANGTRPPPRPGKTPPAVASLPAQGGRAGLAAVGQPAGPLRRQIARRAHQQRRADRRRCRQHDHCRGRWHGGVLRLDDRLRHDPDRRSWQRLYEPVRPQRHPAARCLSHGQEGRSGGQGRQLRWTGRDRPVFRAAPQRAAG